MYDGWRVGFRGDDFDQHAVDEISVGHLDVKPVTAVLHTCFQYLQREREREYLTEVEAWRIKQLENNTTQRGIKPVALLKDMGGYEHGSKGMAKNNPDNGWERTHSGIT